MQHVAPASQVFFELKTDLTTPTVRPLGGRMAVGLVRFIGRSISVQTFAALVSRNGGGSGQPQFLSGCLGA
jgi:hypothetical protein